MTITPSDRVDSAVPHAANPNLTTFRSDINGLRALAVTLVVLFHANAPGFAGGFVGVDVFFVISGYLMTQIISQRFHLGDFSLSQFYLDRFHRIVPALVALCAFSLALGWTWLSPTELAELGQQVASSLAFVSNFLYLHQSGYFDSASHNKLLLHTWSLSVEWQFYLLYPLLLVGLLKLRGARTAGQIVVALTVASATITVAASLSFPNATFYLLPTRAWELLAGAVAFLFPATRLSASGRSLASTTGILLVAAACKSLEYFPLSKIHGQLLAVTGTTLVVWSGAKSSFILGNGAAQFIGKISYSLYLWHWPIAVASRHWFSGDELVRISVIAMGSIGAGWVSFVLFERTRFVRDSGRAPRRHGVLFVATIALTSMASAWAMLGLRLPGTRQDARIAAALNAAIDVNPRRECWDQTGRTSPDCVFGGNGKDVALVLLGDSHADAIVNAVAQSLPSESAGGVLFLGSGCVSVPGVLPLSMDETCSRYLDRQLERLRKEFQSVPVVVVNRWTYYLFGANEDDPDRRGQLIRFTSPESVASRPAFLGEFRHRFLRNFCALARERPVYLLLPIPEMAIDVPSRVIDNLHQGRDQVDVYINRASHNSRHEFIINLMREAKELCGVKLVDPADALCNAVFCSGSIAARPLYFDDDHLNEYGNRLLVPLFVRILND